MKVFISWSGEASNAVACALKEWMPMVIQSVEPWVSEKDIYAGDRWAQSVAAQLETGKFGVICLTPDNLRASWILFEAGALSRSMEEGKIVPLLFNVEFSQVTGPLSQFQGKKLDQTGVKDLMLSINNASENRIDSARIEKMVGLLWPQLCEQLEAIGKTGVPAPKTRSTNEILEELIQSSRSVEGILRDHHRRLQILDDRLSGPGQYRPRSQELMQRAAASIGGVALVEKIEMLDRCRREGRHDDALEMSRQIFDEVSNSDSDRPQRQYLLSRLSMIAEEDRSSALDIPPSSVRSRRRFPES